jgi:hypothetical protein
MARFTLALAAVLMLALSAGLTHGQPEGVPLGSGVASVRGFQDSTDAFQSTMVVTKPATHPSVVQRSPGEEPPAPALLIYLGLILVGSAVSVVLAHRHLQRGI